MMLVQLWALVHKEWLLMKNKKISSTLEIVLPCIFILISGLLRLLITPNTVEAFIPDSFELGDFADSYICSSTNDRIAYTVERELYGSNFTAVILQALNTAITCKDIYFERFGDEKAILHDYNNASSRIAIALIFGKSSSGPFMKIRYPADEIPSTVKYFDNNDDNSDAYIDFTRIQDVAQRAYIMWEANKNSTILPRTIIQKFPVPAHVEDFFHFILEVLVPLYLVLTWAYSISMSVKRLVYEKENRLVEAMKIMGLKNRVYWASFYLTRGIYFTVTSIIITAIVLGFKMYKFSNVGILFCVLMLFVWASLSLCRLMASLFDSSRIASYVSSFIYIILLVPYIVLRSFKATPGSIRKATCLLSPSCLGFAAQIFSAREKEEVGVLWSNISESPFYGIDFALSDVMGMLLVNGILYSLLAWYIEQVFPGKYGVPQKPWFFLLSSFWFGPSKNLTNNVELCRGDINDDENEMAPLNSRVRVSVENLYKEFKTNKGPKVAVNNFSFEMYEGQITALLGHNGAGKTTTMNILAGIYPPTSGTAYINGINICDNMDTIRENLSICPQYNVLWDTLTVEQHLRFYSTLKKIPKDRQETEISLILNDIGLMDHRHFLSMSLSGGMKRKLSVSISLIGSPSFIILDEPTAGMDPQARRSTWDLLLRHKEGKTILLSSHHMDECDILGDRIVIMGEGSLKCSGSSMFLKNRYGAGYRLVCVKKDGCCEDEVLQTIKQHCVDAKVSTNVGAELSIVLPSTSTAVFPVLFNDLDCNLERMNLSSYGISITTLEEVFLKVTAESPIENEEISVDKSALTLNMIDNSSSINNSHHIRNSLTGWKLIFQQMRGLLTKRAINSKRDKKAFFFQFFFPVFFIILSVVLLHNMAQEDLPSLELTLEKVFAQKYEVLYANDNSPYASALLTGNLLTHSMLVKFTTNRDNDIVDYIINRKIKFQYESFGAFNLTENDVTVYYNHRAIHSLPTFISVLNNAVLRTAVQDSAKPFTIVNHPLPLKTNRVAENISTSMNLFFSNVVLILGISFVPSFCSTFPVTERVTRSKHLQFVSGTHYLTYWFSTYIWDIVCYIIITSIVMILYAIFRIPGISANGGILFLLLLLYGISVIPFVYLFTFLFKHPSTAFLSTTAINFLLGFFLYFGIFMLKIFKQHQIFKTLHAIFLLFPQYCFASGIMKISDHFMFLKFQEHVDGVKFTINLYAYKEVGGNLLFMIIMTLVYLFLIICVENRFFLRYLKGASGGSIPSLLNEDEDVRMERERVMSGKADDDMVRIINLRKQYPKKLAVNNISVGIPAGECFGLLGVNGAGKSCTFKMITGEESVTGGDAIMNGHSILSNLREAHTVLGYCPQFDSLIEMLTCSEILTLFARLRGIPENDITTNVALCFDNLQLSQYKDYLCGKLSGGNKRKLNTAIALIGNPPVLLLDEPTAGMDARSRRYLWNFITNIMKSGRAVILTSHNMEEVAALCTRLVIMVNGTFQCLGSPQHIQNKFGSGYTLIAKVGGIDPKILPVKMYIEEKLGNCVLEEEHDDMVHYQLLSRDLSLSTIFSVMETCKEISDLEDYSVSQTTLEQVFLNFAREHCNSNNSY